MEVLQPKDILERKMAEEQAKPEPKQEEKQEPLTEQDDEFILSDTLEKEEEPKSEKAWWETAKEKLGVEADDEETFLKEVKKPKEVFVNDKDSVVKNLKGLLDMDDEGLARQELKLKGWSDDKIEKRIEQLKDRDDLDLFAEDIRAAVKSTLAERQNQINKQEQESLKASSEFRTKVNTNISDALSKTTELFGFKVGRNEEEVAKWQKGMEQYFSKDGFNKDLSKFIKDAHDGNPQALVELAQFIKSREGVFKGLVQQGKSQATKELLSELRNEKTSKEGDRKEERKSEGFEGFLK
jgi:hypothetical protein